MSGPITFISANFVARQLGYPGASAGDWGVHDQATRKGLSARSISAMCAEVSEAGFEAIDIWMAHCPPEGGPTPDFVEQVKGACSNFDLRICGYAGGLSPSLIAPGLRTAKQLGASMLAGGFWGGDVTEHLAQINELCGQLGIKYAFENHPEKSAEEILAKIGHGRFPHVGVALDTGWCGVTGQDALACAKALRPHLLEIHLKDVSKVGGHDTCALGDGVVAVEKVARYLKETGFTGPIGIEHEPFDRDPMPEVVRSLARLKQWLA